MYSQFKEAKEGGTMTVLQPGVHQVFIESLDVVDVATANFNGIVADMVLSDGTLSVKERIFPFAASPNFKDYKTKMVIPDKDQEKQYLDKHMHLFSKAADNTEAMINDVVAAAANIADKALGFKAYINAISKHVVKANGGKDFKALIIDKDGFSKYPMWRGGCAEDLSSNLIKFDPVKHGAKPKPEGMEESYGGEENSDDAPF